MNQHLDPDAARAAANIVDRRQGSFHLEFSRHGDRTRIGQQYVSYPFHMTRPFDLDRTIPQLLTVYQQSSSGGLYRADNLSSKYTIGQRAAAHVTTQAATMVHDCYGEPACQALQIQADADSFFAFTPDPMVLFPGAASETVTHITMSPTSVVLLTESFDRHDPTASSRIFDRITSTTTVHDQSGNLLLRDRFTVAGTDFVSQASPTGAWRIVTNCLILGIPDRLPLQTDLAAIGPTEDAILGVSRLPNNAGLSIRCLANTATAARHICDQLFKACAESALGAAPEIRRK